MSARMKKGRGVRFALCAVLAALVVVLACGCSQSGSVSVPGASSNTLKVGVREAIPGFSSLNDVTGKCTGLEVDIAEELASRLGYQDVEFVTLHADDREKAIAEGQVDCLVATMTITDARRETMDFSPAYYEDETVLLVQSSTGFTKLSDLSGKTVGVVEGSSTKGLLDSAMAGAHLKSASYVERTVYEDLISLLETGAVDAVCLDGCVAQAYLTSDRAILPESLDQISYGVATAKGSELSEPVAQAVQDMLDDGTVAALIDKWD